MAVTLTAVLQRFGAQYLHAHGLTVAQAKAWRAIVACRTPALGGEHLRCEGCGAQHWRWHSCRNRHCPQCQTRQRDAWRAARLAEVLNVPYAHLVFTLPHEINALAAVHARWTYDTLLHCVAATLTDFAANERWLGGMGAFTLVLHTWTQDLRRHLHVHALMACGAMRVNESGLPCWVSPKRSPHFLFPVQALSKVFRGKFLEALREAGAAGALAHDPAATPELRRQREQVLRRHDWVVYAKTPLGGPAAVLDYLSRYTHRTAIGNERLLGIEDERVLLRVRGEHGRHRRVVAIEGTEFIGRLLQHVLPTGFKRIRHYGLLAPAAKAQRLALARQLLAMPAANPRAREDAQAFMRRVTAIDIQLCPHCRCGRWVVIEQLEPVPVFPRSGPWACRGPPLL
jgi:hypothetical protein